MKIRNRGQPPNKRKSLLRDPHSWRRKGHKAGLLSLLDSVQRAATLDIRAVHCVESLCFPLATFTYFYRIFPARPTPHPQNTNTRRETNSPGALMLPADPPAENLRQRDDRG